MHLHAHTWQFLPQGSKSNDSQLQTKLIFIEQLSIVMARVKRERFVDSNSKVESSRLDPTKLDPTRPDPIRPFPMVVRPLLEMQHLHATLCDFNKGRGISFPGALLGLLSGCIGGVVSIRTAAPHLVAALGLLWWGCSGGIALGLLRGCPGAALALLWDVILGLF